MGNIDLTPAIGSLAAAVPVIALDSTDRRHLAVVWRTINPSRVSHTPGDWICHVSTSHDAGATFVDHALAWNAGPLTHCNAPYVLFSLRGALLVGATLTAPSTQGAVPVGAVVIARSVDDGARWSPTVRAIASFMQPRFVTDGSIPAAAIAKPWDGARGAIDAQTGVIALTGSFPARPGGAADSERFVSLSRDGGASFGPIHAFGTSAWPERWDGDIALAHGQLALSYLARATPDAQARCLCAVVAISGENDIGFTRSLAASADAVAVDTLVHYPEIAADPARGGHFAIALIGPGNRTLAAYASDADGTTWYRMPAVLPSGVTSVSRPAIAFTPGGTLVLGFRGLHADGGYDIYVAVAGHSEIGPAVRVSDATSHMPAALSATYAVRGDFHTALAADSTTVYLAWADARNAAGVHVVTGQIPLNRLIRP